MNRKSVIKNLEDIIERIIDTEISHMATVTEKKAKAVADRGAVRTGYTKWCNKLENMLKPESTDDDTSINAAYLTIQAKFAQLKIKDETVQSFLSTEEEFRDEYETVDAYTTTFHAIKIKVDKRLTPIPQTPVANPTTHQIKLHEELPKIEFKKFDGQPQNWLPWWGQFNHKIHNNATLSTEDKFQYLQQCMVPGSPAHECVDSYPLSASNYPIVITTLKERFAQDEWLKEHYFRELLKLVIQQARQVDTVKLSTLVHKIDAQLKNLETLNITKANYESMLFPLVESSLPRSTLELWNRASSSQTNAQSVPTTPGSKLDRLMEFLKQEIKGAERIQLAHAMVESNGVTSPATETLPTAASLINQGQPPRSSNTFNNNNQNSTPPTITCVFCDKSHSSPECVRAQTMTLDERRAIVNNKRVCKICLKSHSGRCRATVKCLFPTCGKRHHAILCTESYRPPQSNQTQSNQTQPESNTRLRRSRPNNNNNNNSNNQSQSGPPSESNSAANVGCIPVGQVYLQTLRINASGTNDNTKVIRAGIDSFSQLCYVTDECANSLGLNKIGSINISHQLFGGKYALAEHSVYVITLSDMSNLYSCQLQVLSQPTICKNVAAVNDQQILQELNDRGIKITDTGSSGPIDLLIGADADGLLRTGKQITLTQGPVAIETKLGWTISGKNNSRPTPGRPLNSYTCVNQSTPLPALWELERIGIQDPIETKTQDVLNAETYDFFNRTTTRINGRYRLQMPWVINQASLQSNFGLAVQRLKSTSSKLHKTNRYDEYDAVLKEWEDLKIIERIDDPSANISHYLPHRPVFRDDAEKTKVRPVFDASAKTINGTSLNDCVSTGPNLLEKIPSTFTQFRLHPFAATADIRKAYLQLELSEADRRYLGFLWWEDKSQQKLVYYRHNRVVFGISCSQFLLSATIQHHLQNTDLIPPTFHETAEKLKNSFYSDDCLDSFPTENNRQKFITEAPAIMELGNFELVNWKLSGEDLENNVKNTTVLGIKWFCKEDTLAPVIPDCSKFASEIITKRSLLSFVNSFFDPMGFIAPATLPLKLWLQKAWKDKCEWDDPLPAIVKDFNAWIRNAPPLQHLRIPRCLNPLNGADQSLHVFCDASGSAIASVIYLRVVNPTETTCRFVIAKHRVAPIPKPNPKESEVEPKPNIPRLELVAALIGVRLANSIRDIFPPEISITYWSDSMITLHWINNQGPQKWSPFVHNRLTEIRKSTTSSDWRHVPGQLNPADLPSRGCDGQQLIDSEWFNGPKFLRLPPENWPRTKIICSADVLQAESRIVVPTLINNNIQSDYSKWITKCSSFSKMIRAIARFRRVIRNKKLPSIERDYGRLSLHEIRKVEMDVIQWVQQTTLDAEKITIRHFSRDGIIRVETKLLNHPVSFSTEPILLPSKSPLTELIIFEQHRALQHAGPQITLTSLRIRYWILRGRSTVEKVLKTCAQCKRFNAQPFATPPAPLPLDRTNINVNVFQISGVDYAGPLYLKGQVDGEQTKAWICLFTCAVYRAIHLELVTSLSTDYFLDAFRRFINRRGRPQTMYSDNGTNFRGADNLFASLDWDRIIRESSTPTHRIEWNFNPPKAPWWGGFFERMVKSVKDLLRRNLGQALLTYEELNTILTDVEATVNSRPLTYLSENVEDLTPLTPNTFLRPIPNSEVTDIDTANAASLNLRVRHVNEIRENIKSRFEKEYLALLVHTGNGKVRSAIVKVGDIVCVSDDTNKRVNWPLAKVIEVYPGRDGVIRKVKLKLRNGELLRPVQKIYPLELSAGEGNQLLKNHPEPKPIAKTSPNGTAPTLFPREPRKKPKLQINSLASDPPPVPIVTRLGRTVRQLQRLNL